MKEIESTNQGISLFIHNDMKYHTVYQQYGNNPELRDFIQIDKELYDVSMFYEYLYAEDCDYKGHRHDMIYLKYHILLDDIYIKITGKNEIKTSNPTIIFGSLLGTDYMYIYDNRTGTYTIEPNIEARIDITNRPVKIKYTRVDKKIHIDIIL